MLIIEDEEPAAKRLLKMIKELEPTAEPLAVLSSVAESIVWLTTHPAPDMIFCDIQLSDGISFEIFSRVDSHSPVIFITAFDHYAIEAFKLNSIAYLLKPLKKEELQTAINKYKKWQQPAVANPVFDYSKLMETWEAKTSAYKKRFVVRYGEHIKTINTDEIAYCYTEDKVNFLCTHDGRRYVADFNLDQLETLLPPDRFFRINRQYIIGITAIREMLSYTKGRVLVKLNPAVKEDPVVSTERSAAFKTWLADGS
jgi:DNA-binding LytR/AlgR family response regulator